MTAFNRRIRVTVVDDTGTGRAWEDVRIDIDVAEDTTDTPAVAAVEMYNLTESSRTWLEADRILSVEVSYGDAPLQRIFAGRIEQVFVDSAPPDRIVRVEASAGGRELRGQRVSGVIPAGTPLPRVLELVTSSLRAAGLEVADEDLGALLSSERLTEPLSVAGTPGEVLERVSARLGLCAWVTDQTIRFGSRRAPALRIDGTVVLTPDTGLIRSPVRGDETVEVTSLMNPRLRPGRVVALRSELISGLYRVDQVRHRGSLWLPEFYSICELVALEDTDA